MTVVVRDQIVNREPVEEPLRVERIAWEYIAVQAAGIWLATRLALATFTYFSVTLSRPNSTAHTLLFAWYRWDAIDYVDIATHGYVTPQQGAFFPLYPLLIALGAFVLGHAALVAMLVSNLGTLAAFIGVALLSVDEGGDEHTARYTVLALASWPLAFFLAAGYTEGIFVALAVWCLWSMRRGYWYVAAACAFFAALCRSTGIILFLPLLYEFARQHGWVQWLRWRDTPLRLARKDILPLSAVTAAIPLGIGIFSLYCWKRYNDPLHWLTIQSVWSRVTMPLWESISKGIAYPLSLSLFSYNMAHLLIDTLPLLAIIVVTAIGVRKLPVAYTLYLLGMLYLTLSSPRTAIPFVAQNIVYFGSAGRFMLVAIPAFLLIGKWSSRYPTVATIFIYGGTLLQAAFLASFLAGKWIV